MTIEHNTNFQKAMWTVIVTVILAAGAYMLQSRDTNTQLTSKVEATTERVIQLEGKVVVINSTLQDLKVSKATTEKSIENLEELSDKLEVVVDRLTTTVIKLEERLPKD